MPRPLSHRTRRALSSLAYGALVVLVIGLGYVTFTVVHHPGGSTAPAVVPAAPPSGASVEVAGFWARRDKRLSGDQLTVSAKLRTATPGLLRAYVYVVVRNDQASPRRWAVWPPQEPGNTVSAGGHLRSTDPTTGQAVTLSSGWTRVTATLDEATDHPRFDTALVYVLSPAGDILLVRPFAL